jgi:hypothetical protein
MAVMMMVAMRPRVHSLKIKKIVFAVNYGFFLPYFVVARLFSGYSPKAEDSEKASTVGARTP